MNDTHFQTHFAACRFVYLLSVSQSELLLLLLMHCDQTKPVATTDISERERERDT